jgi:hypothetical protein
MLVLGPGFHDCSTDLVSQRERQLFSGGNAVLPEADVGMTDAAAGDFHDDFVVTGLGLGDVPNFQGGAHCG